MPINVAGFQPMEDFEKRIREIFKSGVYGPSKQRFEATVDRLENDSLRVGLRSGKRQLHFTVAPGPKLDDRYAILLKSSKDSEFARIITPEIYYKSTGEGRFVQGENIFAREDPFQSLVDYAYGSFRSVPSLRTTDLQGQFNKLLAYGHEKLGLAGGVMSVSPHYTPSTLVSMARRTTVGFSKDIKQHQQEDILFQMGKMASAGANPPGTGRFYERLRGMLPYVGDDLRVRWRQAAVANPARDVYEMLGGANKIKHMNVAYSEKEELTPTALKQIGPDGKLIPKDPMPITTGRESGLRLSNVQMGESGPRSIWVERDVFKVAGVPDSGAMTLYRPEIFQGKGDTVGPFFETKRYQALFPEDYDDMLNTRFEWGIHKQRRTNEGKLDFDEHGNPVWERVSDLKGYSLAPGETAVIGLMTTQRGGKQYTTPITQTGDERFSTFTDNPTVVVPPFQDPYNRMFSPVSGKYRERSKDKIIYGKEIPEEEKEIFRKQSQGGNVSFTGGTTPSIAIPLATQSGFSIKTGGTKVSQSIPYGLINLLNGQPAVNIGGTKRSIGAITGDIKNPLVSFYESVPGTMDLDRLEKFIGRLYGKDTPMLQEVERVKPIQAELKQRYASGEINARELRESWQGVDFERLAKLHGQGLSGWGMVENMFTKTTLAMRQSPREMLRDYDIGVVDDPQWVKYRTIHKDYQKYYEERIKESAREAAEKSKGELSERKALRLAKSMYRFSEVPNSNQVLWEIQYQGQFGSLAGGIVTEHPIKGLPRRNPEAMAALYNEAPEVYESIVAMQDAVRSPGLKSWEHLEKLHAWEESGLKMSGKQLPPGESTSVSQEQADKILNAFATLKQKGSYTSKAKEGEDPAVYGRTFEGYQRILEDILGDVSAPFLHMETSGIYFPTPEVARHAAEYEVDALGDMHEVSGASYTYPEALVQAVAGGTYEDKAMRNYYEDIASTLAQGGDLLKRLYSKNVIGHGGHTRLGGYLPPFHALISDTEMERNITLMAKAEGFEDDPSVFRGGRLTREYLDTALQDIREAGGLKARFEKAPKYTRGKSAFPLTLVSESLAKEKFGLPEWVNLGPNVEEGKFTGPSTGLWGFFEVGPEGEVTFEDKDVDPGQYDITSRVTRKGNIVDRKDPLARVVSGLKDNKLVNWLNKALSSITGQKTPGTFSAPVNSMMDTILQRTGVEERALEKSGLARESQMDMVRGGLGYVDVKRSMGPSYRGRDLTESALISMGTFNSKQVDEGFDALGLSYTRHLENEQPVPRRAVEEFFGRLFFTAKKTSGRGIIAGMKTMQDYGTVGKTGEGAYSIGEFDEINTNKFATGFRRALQSDTDKGYLTEDAALMYLSRSGEEWETLKKRLHKGGERFYDIMTSVMDSEDYDFSQSVAGFTLGLKAASKLHGVPGYKFPETDFQDFPGKSALQVLKGELGRFGGEEHILGDLMDVPWVQEGLSILDYKKANKPVSFVSRVELERKARAMEDKGERLPAFVQSMRESLHTPAAFEIFDNPNVHKENLIDFSKLSDYRISPSDFPSLSKEEDSYQQQKKERIISDLIFNIPDIEDILGKEKKWTDAGKLFEIEMKGRGITKDFGLTNVQEIYKHRDADTPQFGKFRYKPDIMGVHKETGKLMIADLKWSATNIVANKKITDRSWVGPQLEGYSAATAEDIENLSKEEFVNKHLSSLEASVRSPDDTDESYKKKLKEASRDLEVQYEAGKEGILMGVLSGEGGLSYIDANAPKQANEDVDLKGNRYVIDPQQLEMVGQAIWEYSPVDAAATGEKIQNLLKSFSFEDITATAQNILSAYEKEPKRFVGVPQTRIDFVRHIAEGGRTTQYEAKRAAKLSARDNLKDRYPRQQGAQSLPYVQLNEPPQSQVDALRGGGGGGGGGEGGEGGGIDDPRFEELRKANPQWDDKNMTLMEWWKDVGWEEGLQIMAKHWADPMQSVVEQIAVLTGDDTGQKARFLEKHDYISTVRNAYEKGVYELGAYSRGEVGQDYEHRLIKEIQESYESAGLKPPTKVVKTGGGGEGYHRGGRYTSKETAYDAILGDLNALSSAAPGEYEDLIHRLKPEAKKLETIQKKAIAGAAAGSKPEVSDIVKQAELLALEEIRDDKSGKFTLASVISGAGVEKIGDPRKHPSLVEGRINLASEKIDKLAKLGDSTDNLIEKFDNLSKTTEGYTKLQVEALEKVSGAIAEVRDTQSEAELDKAVVRESSKVLREYEKGEGAISSDVADAWAKLGGASAKRLVTREKKIQDLEKALEGIETGDPEVIGETKFTRGFRQVFGGWGLMYMGRLAQMSVGQLQKSFAETEAYDIASLKAARRIYGTGYGEGISPIAYQQQGARLRGGGGMYGDIARFGTAIDDLSAITSPVGTGIAAALATNFLAPVAGPLLGTSAGAIAGAAGPVGLAVGTIAFTAQQIRNINNEEDTILRSAAQKASGKPLASWATLWGTNLANVGGMIASGDMKGRPPSEIEKEKYAEQVERLNSGQMTMQELMSIKAQGDDEYMKFVKLASYVTEGSLGEISATATTSALLGLPLQSDMDPNAKVIDTLLPVALDMEDQGAAAQVANMVFGLKGGGALPGDKDRLTAKIADMGYEAEGVVSGLQLMSQMPNPVREFRELSEDEIVELAGGLYKDIQAGPYAGMFRDRANLVEAAEREGIHVALLPHKYTADQEWTQEQLYERAQSDLKLERQITLKRQAREAGLGYEEARAFAFDQSRSAEAYQLGTAQINLYNQFQSVGYSAEDAWTKVSGYAEEGMTGLNVGTRFANIEGAFSRMGIPPEMLGGLYERHQGAGGAEFIERLLSFDPRAYGQEYNYYAARGGAEDYLSTIEPIAALANYDFWTGQPTTQSRYRTSMVGPGAGALANVSIRERLEAGITTQDLSRASAEKNAERIWGADWRESEVGRSFTYGVNKETGEAFSSWDEMQAAPQENVRMGEQGFAWRQIQLNYESAMASIGSSYAQIALQEEYMPKFWDVQDRQRELAHRQQTWQFEQQEWQLGFSERQMEMGAQQWQERFGLQQKQAYMQRQWTQEDWGYQDLTRSLQWGWKQEDFAENVRFMTGRQRKLAERGMERETTMYNLESGQIDTQRERQKELWALQDERFDMEATHHKEQLAMQEEALEKQKEQFEMQKRFYEERRQLEEESIQLSREYQKKQLELQKAALGVQAQQIEKQKKLAEDMLDYQEDQEAAIDNAKTLQQEATQFFNDMIDGIALIADNWDNMIQSIIDNTDFTPNYLDNDKGGGGGGGGGGDGSGDVPIYPKAIGGDMFSGMSYLVGERKPELVRPGTIGSVVTQYDIAQVVGQQDKWSSRSVFYPTQRGVSGDGGGPSVINVYVGNEKLASFVLDTVRRDLEVI